MHLWLLATRKTAADGSALARAVDYSLRRWPALARYAENGFYPIDNNPVENAIRPIAIGKKTGYLPAPKPPANAPQSFSPCWKPLA